MKVSTTLYTKASAELEEEIKKELEVKDPAPAVAKAILNERKVSEREERDSNTAEHDGSGSVSVD